MAHAHARVLALAAALCIPAADGLADSTAGRPAGFAGPGLAGPADLHVDVPRLDADFGEGGRTVHLTLVLPLRSDAGGEALVGFGAVGTWRFHAFLDGQAVGLEPAPADLGLEGGPFDEQVVVRVPLAAGVPALLELRADGDTTFEERDPRLTYPQATFILNRLLEGPRARFVELWPGPALLEAPELRMRVGSAPPQRPEAPVAGDVVDSGGRLWVEGPVVADATVPLVLSAVEGDYEQPRNWGFTFGIGAAIDWARMYGCPSSSPCDEADRRWYTDNADGPGSRVWFRGMFAWAFGRWLLEAGLEGDFAGALEVPLLFTYYPQDGSPGFFDLFGDWHLILGVSLQLINDRMPEDHGFDPRPFLRLGAGLRFLMVTLDLAYEIAPPLGGWGDRYGGLEHKLLITLPWRF
ncbi:MAG: hypothetical protein JXB32_07910 [Deltaproteobacteria bacterium]|nr:hypothetical protein [Deltaproteobacteria bacterium]